jgi:hypothetical protein
MQALDTCPNRITDFDGQFAAFQSLIDEPQAHHEFLFAKRCFGGCGLAWPGGCGEVPDGLEFALRQARATPEIADDDVGYVIWHGWREQQAAIRSEEAFVALAFAFGHCITPAFSVAWWKVSYYSCLIDKVK